MGYNTGQTLGTVTDNTINKMQICLFM